LTPSPILIALGSNIAPERNLPAAVRLLAERVAVRAASHVFESAPLNAAGEVAPDQETFLNAAVRIETDLPPVELKYGVLRAVETALGRVRGADKFAARPIDLDLALYGSLVLEDLEAHITLPDPGILVHAHLALPLADLAPEFVHPLTGQALAAIAAPLAAQPGITLRRDIVLLP
jgi:2-amino-4-hydroxy-6-hydroxymethyldihydropteridine diphosphokinase